MTYEAVTIELLGNKGDPVRFTIADTSAVTKGALLSLVTPRTASGSLLADGNTKPICGIAAADKTAGDGSTSIACYTYGIFDMYCSGSVVLGQPVVQAGYNYVKGSVGAVSGSFTIGYTLEASSGNEVIAIKVGI